MMVPLLMVSAVVAWLLYSWGDVGREQVRMYGSEMFQSTVISGKDQSSWYPETSLEASLDLNTSKPRVQAVVFKTIQIVDECRVQRVSSLVELTKTLHMDVWVLFEPWGSVTEAVYDLASRHDHVFLGTSPTLDESTLQGENDDWYIKQQWWSFLVWLNQSDYTHAWYMEDDIVYTGSWTAFFRNASDQAKSSDLVASFKNETIDWDHADDCYVSGRPCIQNNSILMTKMVLYRISRRLAVRSLELRARGEVEGYYEGFAAPICYQWAGCVRSDMFFPGGVYELGSWGMFTGSKKNRIYTLTGLASYNNEEVDYSLYPTNADVPRDCLYHPVKCEAEMNWSRGGKR